MTDRPSLEDCESSSQFGANETQPQSLHKNLNLLPQFRPNENNSPACSNFKTNKLLTHYFNQNSNSSGIDPTDDELLEISDSLFYLGRAIVRYFQQKEESHAS